MPKFLCMNIEKQQKLMMSHLKPRISHDYFIDGLAEDQECTLSCLKGTQAEKIKVKADCHVLKNVNDKMSGNRCIANTGWILSDQGYVSLNIMICRHFQKTDFI